jgi:hypothetical protein
MSGKKDRSPGWTHLALIDRHWLFPNSPADGHTRLPGLDNPSVATISDNIRSIFFDTQDMKSANTFSLSFGWSGDGPAI